MILSFSQVRAQFGESDAEGNIVLDLHSRRGSHVDTLADLDKVLNEKIANAAATKEVVLSADMADEEDEDKKMKREAPEVKRSMVAWVLGMNRPEVW